MSRFHMVCAVAGLLAGVALGGVDDDLTLAAKSPYELARFVDSHKTFEWQPLWKALDVDPELMFLPPCGRCSTELLTVLDPFQIIVILRHEASQYEDYLRYVRPSGEDAPGPWQFTGAYSPFVKYFAPRHRLEHIGRKTFLVVTGQGAAGTGVSSEVDDWLDLTSPEFKEVLTIVMRGTFSELGRKFGLEISGSVASVQSEPVENIRIAYSARLIQEGKPIASRYDGAVYARRGDTFVFDAPLSRSLKSDIEDLYTIDGATDDRLQELFPR